MYAIRVNSFIGSEKEQIIIEMALSRRIELNKTMLIILGVYEIVRIIG